MLYSVNNCSHSEHYFINKTLAAKPNWYLTFSHWLTLIQGVPLSHMFSPMEVTWIKIGKWKCKLLPLDGSRLDYWIERHLGLIIIIYNLEVKRFSLEKFRSFCLLLVGKSCFLFPCKVFLNCDKWYNSSFILWIPYRFVQWDYLIEILKSCFSSFLLKI